MNLTTEAWIPIVWADARPGSVSLCEAFKRGHEIRDLAVRPHERIAVIRLLICVAQAALDGPRDNDDWESCRLRIVPAASDYLKRWRAAFELFGGGQRFLQVSNLKKPEFSGDEEEGNSVSKLDLVLATGNNTTLFDNAGGSKRAFTAPELALMLTTFQCFSPGGRIGVAVWNGRETPGNGSSNHAPCLAGGMLHALVRGDHLLATIHKNLMSKEQVDRFYGSGSWGKPVWENSPQRLSDAEAAHNATRTYLGRLLPLARAISLGEDGESLILANGFQYESFQESGWREPTATVIARTAKGESKRVVLRASVERALWRELYALTVKEVGEKPGGPAALQHLTGDKPFDLWVGALVADRAKPLDTVESVFHVPAEMLYDTGQKVYEEGVRRAEMGEWRLRRAVVMYHNQLGDKLDRPEMKNRRQQIQSKAVAQYWTDVEQALPYLLGIAENRGKLGQPAEWYKTDWGKAVWSAMRTAYERACPHETPRQMRAYALGSRTLFSAPTEEDRSVEEDEE
jgi:CRISPR system Cascade subunit CasA